MSNDTTRAALMRALEALREATTYTASESWSPSMTRECEAAIAAAEAALAAPQEPVATDDKDFTRIAFDAWWMRHGQYLRAGGGDYEKTFAWHAWESALTIPCKCPPAAPRELSELQPISTAPTDEFILVRCPSGYTTTPFVFTTAITYSDYKAGRWVDHANDDLTDWGMEPTHWMPLSAIARAPARAEPTDAEIDALMQSKDWRADNLRLFARAVLALRDGGKASQGNTNG